MAVSNQFPIRSVSNHCRPPCCRAGVLRLLQAAGVAVPAPQHLTLADPRLLAWLLEPQLLQVHPHTAACLCVCHPLPLRRSVPLSVPCPLLPCIGPSIPALLRLALLLRGFSLLYFGCWTAVVPLRLLMPLSISFMLK
jgi:hypothetical protein